MKVDFSKLDSMRIGKYLHYKIDCNQCYNPVWKRRLHIERNNTLFCNTACAGKFRSTSIEVSCSRCDKKIKRNLSVIKRSKRKIYFCSPKCANAFYMKERQENSVENGFRNGNSYRSRALGFYGHKCMAPECLISKSKIEIVKGMLDVDHIDGNRSNNNIRNLQVLCVWCHALKTRKISDRSSAGLEYSVGNGKVAGSSPAGLTSFEVLSECSR